MISQKQRDNLKRYRDSDKGVQRRVEYASANKDKISEQNRKYRAKHRDALNEKNRNLRQSRKSDPIEAPSWVRRKMLRDAEQRAIAKSLPFNLRIEDIASPSVCPIFGIRLNWTRSIPGFDSPSLDRISNNQGYTPENVWVISRRANVIKSDASPSELRLIADAVDRKMRVREIPHA